MCSRFLLIFSVFFCFSQLYGQCNITHRVSEGTTLSFITPEQVAAREEIQFKLGASTDQSNFFIGLEILNLDKKKEPIGPLHVVLENGFKLSLPLKQSADKPDGDKIKIFAVYLVSPKEVILLNNVALQSLSFDYLDGGSELFDPVEKPKLFLCH